MFRFKEEFRIIEKVDSGSYITQFHMKSSLGGEFIVKTIPLPTEYVMYFDHYS